MDWFKRQKAGIQTSISEQNSVPEGQWTKCPGCSEIVNQRQLDENKLVCPKCGHHFLMDSAGYFDLLFDEGRYERFDDSLHAVDALDFVDRKPYKSRLVAARKKTDLNDAIRSGLQDLHYQDKSRGPRGVSSHAT